MTRMNRSEKETAAKIAQVTLKRCKEAMKWARAMEESMREGSDKWEAYLSHLDRLMGDFFNDYMMDFEDQDDAEDARDAQA